MKKGNKRTLFIFAGLFVLASAFGGFQLFQYVDARYPWIWSYSREQIFPAKDQPVTGPRHIMFTFADHFEPHDQTAMERWMESYPKAASRHVDKDGRRPQHTWFWFFSESEEEEKFHFLKQLSELVFQGLGEVELHLHHFNDNEEAFIQKMKAMIQISQQTGAMVTAEEFPRTAFGFIHGLWSLDNSRGIGACGVNNELILLRRLGCYADFTHASWGAMHPRIVNRLYYAVDDPNLPKSYDRGGAMRIGEPGVGDLLIFEGPSVVRFNSMRPSYDHGDVTHVDLPTPERVDSWIKTNIHVQGRPEWIFVKIFTHGAVEEDHEAVLGEWFDKMHSYLEKRYNDGRNYVLHYVTAREAYNIAKAAEAGESGNPNDYRDFLIRPYVNRFLTASVPFETVSFTRRRAAVRFLVPKGTEVKVKVRLPAISVSGDAASVKTESSGQETFITFITKGSGLVGFTSREAAP